MAKTRKKQPPQEPPPPAPQSQDKLDLEDARQRLATMHKALLAKDFWEVEVRRLSSQLIQAKRRLREAGWDLALAIGAERRRSSPPEPLTSTFDQTPLSTPCSDSPMTQEELPL